MILNMTGGGLSSTKIIHVASAANLPANAEVGTIAIVSSTAVGKVTVSATQPASPGTGDVWVTPGTSSLRMIVHKGVAYAISVIKQYINGAWTEVTYTQYAEDGWITLTVYLLNGADDCTSISGGWKGLKVYSASVTRNYDNYYLAGANKGAQHCELQSVNKVDLTPYSKLKFDVSFSPNTDYGKVFRVGAHSVSHSESVESWEGWITAQEPGTTGRQTVTVDVSSIKTSGYINAFTGGYLYVYKIWLEV